MESLWWATTHVYHFHYFIKTARSLNSILTFFNLFVFPVDSNSPTVSATTISGAEIPPAVSIEAMPKRAAEVPPSSETHRIRPDAFCSYRTQVSDLLSQDERISHDHDQQANESPIGAGMSNVKKENMNNLLRQCVRNLVPEVDEMQQRVYSMHLISQLGNESPSSSPSKLKSVGSEAFGGAREDDIQLLLRSDPDLVKKITSQYSNILLSKLEDMEQEVENLLDEVVTTCRPMTCDEKRDLQKSIKELPDKNLDRVAEIVENHYIPSGNDLSEEVIVNLNQLDNVTLWRLHYYVAAVKSANDLAC